LGIILTGLILYTHTYHEGLGGLLYHILRPLEAAMGGLADVRTYHRILMWVIMIFVPVHIYMAIFNAVKGKDGAMDAIISGYKFVKEEQH
ncbi:TPA: cytochrome b/b6 domain-containing protein, partial [Campylobacter jejuni]|nr:cytochrome b/b6 domain-containing protein [Campylobacter jejuni]